jgi:hypothetical protein
MPVFLLPVLSAILSPIISKLVGKAETLQSPVDRPLTGQEKFSWVAGFFDDCEDLFEKYGVITAATHSLLDKWDGLIANMIENEVAKLKAK